jgi:hypothetical protein
MTHFEWIAAAIIGILSAGRLARLLVFDDFPPAVWLRRRWFVAVGDSNWKGLFECPFCMAPYLVAGSMAWFYFSDGHWSWWIANGWWAASYLAAIVVAYDEGAA